MLWESGFFFEDVAWKEVDLDAMIDMRRLIVENWSVIESWSEDAKNSKEICNYVHIPQLMVQWHSQTGNTRALDEASRHVSMCLKLSSSGTMSKPSFHPAHRRQRSGFRNNFRRHYTLMKHPANNQYVARTASNVKRALEFIQLKQEYRSFQNLSHSMATCSNISHNWL